MSSGSAYGSSLARRLKPRHVSKVIANETRMLFSELIIPRLRIADKQFLLWGQPVDYFLHRYNTTWRNERSIELAAASIFLSSRPAGSLLEFGNVLRHYQLGKPDLVVDLYEKGDRITNVDIVDFESNQRFDSIISISTIEHVGWDEIPQVPEKVEEALTRLTTLLSPTGTLFITAPTGHNLFLDELIRNGIPNVIRQAFFVRDGFEWTQSDEFAALEYGSKGPGAASVWFAEIGSSIPSIAS
jgi:hypothetical protein